MKPFPIPDNSLNYIYAEQVIEHLPFEGGMVMLRESHRVLAPGGKLRLATPDLRQLVALFDQDHTEAERRFMRRIELVPRREYHVEQFDLEDENGIGRDHPRHAGRSYAPPAGDGDRGRGSR